MTKGRLIILRHGETDYNVQRLMTGQRDVPLNATGEAQADAAGLKIKGLRIDKAYSSTLSRAFNSVARALKSGGQAHLLNPDGSWQIEKRKEIIELDTGHFTGRCHRTDPEILAWERAYDKPLPGGESDKQVVERVRAFHEAEILPRLMRGETVILGVHSGIVRAYDVVLGLDDPDEDGISGKGKKKVPNAAPVVFVFEEGEMTHFYPAGGNPANPNLHLPPPKFRG